MKSKYVSFFLLCRYISFLRPKIAASIIFFYIFFTNICVKQANDKNNEGKLKLNCGNSYILREITSKIRAFTIYYMSN